MSQHFDYVFMDLHIPVLDGFETIERMRQMPEIDFSRMKVIAFSAKTEQ